MSTGVSENCRRGDSSQDDSRSSSPSRSRRGESEGSEPKRPTEKAVKAGETPGAIKEERGKAGRRGRMDQVVEANIMGDGRGGRKYEEQEMEYHSPARSHLSPPALFTHGARRTSRTFQQGGGTRRASLTVIGHPHRELSGTSAKRSGSTVIPAKRWVQNFVPRRQIDPFSSSIVSETLGLKAASLSVGKPRGGRGRSLGTHEVAGERGGAILGPSFERARSPQLLVAPLRMVSPSMARSRERIEMRGNPRGNARQQKETQWQLYRKLVDGGNRSIPKRLTQRLPDAGSAQDYRYLNSGANTEHPPELFVSQFSSGKSIPDARHFMAKNPAPIRRNSLRPHV
jgi:hypothetical protein